MEVPPFLLGGIVPLRNLVPSFQGKLFGTTHLFLHQGKSLSHQAFNLKKLPIGF